MRALRHVALVALSAVLFGLSFPPYDLHGLAWIALVPFLLAIRHAEGAASAAGLAWLWSVLAAYAVGDWFPRSLARYYDQPLGVGIAFFLGVATTMAAPYYIAFSWIYRCMVRRPGAWVPMLAAAAWTAAELGRGRLLTGTPFFIGNPWALVGYSQVGVGPVIQIASVTGIYGVGFAVMAMNAGLVELFESLRGPSRRRGIRPAMGAAAITPGILILVFGWGVLRAAGPVRTASERIPVSVAQGNVEVGARWREDLYGAHFGTYLRLTHEAIVDHHPRIVFWPESSMTFLLDSEPLYQKSLADVLAFGDTELVAGGPFSPSEDGAAFYNSVFAIAPDGEILGRYDKRYLVPFAEYFPFSRIDVMRRRFGRLRTFSAGGAAELLPTRAGSAGVVVCNEAMLPEVVAERVRSGADYIVNPTNDTWIDEPKYTRQQLDIVRVRAVEQRRHIVRASTSGPSAIIDPWGRVTARSEPGVEAVVHGAISPRSGRSFYGHFGDAFAFGCLGVITVAGLIWLRRGNEEGGS